MIYPTLMKFLSSECTSDLVIVTKAKDAGLDMMAAYVAIINFSDAAILRLLLFHHAVLINIQYRPMGAQLGLSIIFMLS